MSATARITVFVAIGSMLGLAACSEEQTATAEPPAAEERQAPPAEPEKPALETAREGIDKLRDAANQALKDAQPAIDRARETAEQAIEDAGPALQKAGEYAEKLRQSVDEIIARARTDFDTAIRELEKRLAESDIEIAPPTASPDALLSPAGELNADTRAAARADQAGMGPAFVGVWATDAASCARIDRDPVELFAVITPTTIRRYEKVCNYDPPAGDGGDQTVTASCIAEGDVEEREIAFSMADENSLAISTPGQEGAAELVRCRLPG